MTEQKKQKKLPRSSPVWFVLALLLFGAMDAGVTIMADTFWINDSNNNVTLNSSWNASIVIINQDIIMGYKDTDADGIGDTPSTFLLDAPINTGASHQSGILKFDSNESKQSNILNFDSNESKQSNYLVFADENQGRTCILWRFGIPPRCLTWLNYDQRVMNTMYSTDGTDIKMYSTDGTDAVLYGETTSFHLNFSVDGTDSGHVYFDSTGNYYGIGLYSPNSYWELSDTGFGWDDSSGAAFYVWSGDGVGLYGNVYVNDLAGISGTYNVINSTDYATNTSTTCYFTFEQGLMVETTC